MALLVGWAQEKLKLGKPGIWIVQGASLMHSLRHVHS